MYGVDVLVSNVQWKEVCVWSGCSGIKCSVEGSVCMQWMFCHQMVSGNKCVNAVDVLSSNGQWKKVCICSGCYVIKWSVEGSVHVYAVDVLSSNACSVEGSVRMQWMFCHQMHVLWKEVCVCSGCSVFNYSILSK